jgi:hypothetical protein
MKAWLLCGLLATGFAANAQDPKAVSLSQAEAVREFPALSQQGSSFNKRFVERFNSLKTAGDSLLLRDDWPLVLAKQIGIELGIDPLVSVATHATDPKPTATPWKPLGTMLDPHPSEGTMLDANQGASQKYFVAGTVIQRTPDGLLIECNRTGGSGYKQPKGDVWLVGKDATVGDTIRTVATKLGTYTYTTVDGADRMVDEFQAQP